MKPPKISYDDNLRPLVKKPKKLKKYIRHLEKELLCLTDDSEIVQALGQLGYYYGVDGDYLSAISTLTDAIEVADESHWSTIQYIPLKIRLGDIFRYLNDFKSSDYILKNVLETCEQDPDCETYLDFAHQHLGKNYFDQTLYYKAISHFEQALEIRQQKSSPKDQMASSQLAIETSLKRIEKRENSLEKHYIKTKNRPSSPLLDIVEETVNSAADKAYDLGCGTGNDSFKLSEFCDSVIAVDQNPKAIESFHSDSMPRVKPLVASFEDLELEPCCIINASLAFPFCRPEHFTEFWSGISQSLNSGGLISGHFFGTKDGWSSKKNMTFHSEDQILDCFKDFDILFFDEFEGLRHSTDGPIKNWQIYSFVIQKPDASA